jgi:5-formyltetrahydrofolate cyclo-ligase
VRRSLYFAPYTPGMAMRSNRFGILEPQVHPRHWRRAQDLDLILLPLVAFDLHGHRVGMGGGFYDRSLAFRAHRVHRVKPHLIGLAHELQKVAAVNAQHWDIPLDAIATEQHIYPTGNV